MIGPSHLHLHTARTVEGNQQIIIYTATSISAKDVFKEIQLHHSSTSCELSMKDRRPSVESKNLNGKDVRDGEALS